MEIYDAIQWLESLKNSISSAEHRALWHYAEAIDSIIDLLGELEEKNE